MENDYISLSTELSQVITTEQAWHYSIIPKSANNSILELFIDQELQTDDVKNELEMLYGKDIILFGVNPHILNKTLGIYYRKTKKSSSNPVAKFNCKSDDFLYKIIEEAHTLGCSDIHIEKYDEICRIRLRIDGKLIEKYLIDKNEYPALINKIKIKANLDIAEKRLPQDGRIYFTSENEKFDIRVSVLPTLYGEKAVLRLLSKDSTAIDINQLGFNTKQLEDYLEGIKKPHGIVLISGPTGSGKTTTLYATLKILNKENTNILTIEDPIEYTLDGINQTQLKESIGLTFASALRTFLRQDPDIIMLGEIRDGETAQMAIRAALTGHLVLSTIHTNSAWGTITRLVDMGIPSFLLASTINLTVAQRLVRVLCPSCKEKKEFNARLFPKDFEPPRNIRMQSVSVGCEECFYTGYKGRKAVYEVIPVDLELAEMIKSSKFDINEIFKSKQLKRLSDSAFELFENGETTIEEIYPILINSI